MADPWIRGTATVWPHGPGQSPDSVTSLANGQAKGLGSLNAEALGLATPLGDLILPPWKITTGSGGVSGTISRYLIFSEDGARWTGGVDPTSSSDQSAALTAMLAANSFDGAIDTLTVGAATTAYYFPWRAVRWLAGNTARYMSVLIYNQSGQALNAAAGNHAADYATESYA